jgi:hypothetical protein
MENRIVRELDYALIVIRDDRWLCAFDKIQQYQQSLPLDTFFGTT